MYRHLRLIWQNHKPHQLQKDPKEIPRTRARQDQREHQAHQDQKEVLLQKHLVQKGQRARKGVLHQGIQAQQDQKGLLRLLNRKDRPHLLDHLSLLCQVVQGHLGRQEGPRPRGPRVPQDPMEELSRHRRLLDPQEPTKVLAYL